MPARSSRCTQGRMVAAIVVFETNCRGSALRLGGLADWAQTDAPLGHCLDTLTAVAERERLPTAPGFERVGVVRSVGVFKTREQRPARLRVEPGGGGRAGSGSYAVRGR